jgi:hypothetical protein
MPTEIGFGSGENEARRQRSEVTSQRPDNLSDEAWDYLNQNLKRLYSSCVPIQNQ